MKGRCVYEGEDVFMKERCIYEGRKKILEFEEIESKMLFKNQRNPWNFPSQKWTNSGNF